MGRSRTPGIAVTVLFLPAVAIAAGFGHRAGTETWTAFSGTDTRSHASALTTADYYGLQVLKMWQYGGRSCVLDIEQSAFATRALSRLDSMKVCEPTGGSAWKQSDVGSGKFVHAVAVCTGKSKDDATIRGIELWGSSIEPDGTLKPSKGGVKLEFPECKKWQAKESCPPGAVATGLRGAFDPTHGLVGVALRCHQLEARGPKGG